jgi:hypothetical protein
MTSLQASRRHVRSGGVWPSPQKIWIQNRLDVFSWHLGLCNTTSESDEMHTISEAGINETLLLPRGRNRQEMFRKVKKVK